MREVETVVRRRLVGQADVTFQPIAALVNGLDEGRRPEVVAEGSTELGDGVGQDFLADRHVRPDALEQGVARPDKMRRFGERLKHLRGLGRQPPLLAAAKQPALAGSKAHVPTTIICASQRICLDSAGANRAAQLTHRSARWRSSGRRRESGEGRRAHIRCRATGSRRSARLCPASPPPRAPA